MKKEKCPFAGCIDKTCNGENCCCHQCDGFEDKCKIWNDGNDH